MKSIALPLAIAAAVLAARAPQAPAIRDWPAVTREAKPWTRWWWHGSAVDRGSLTSQLDQLRAAGIGGVEITPIYGVRGAESRFIPYLSDAWMGMFRHVLGEGLRLDLGVDMATGTGWPFGGPWVDDDIAPRSIAHRTWTLASGARLADPVRMEQGPLVRAIGNQIHVVNEGAPGDPPRTRGDGPVLRTDARAIQIGDLAQPVTANPNLQALALEQVKYPRDLPLIVLMAYSTSGDVVDLTSRVGADGMLDWAAPSGEWTLHGLFAGWHGKLVERAAPGGEGNVIDHFSRDAIRAYLARFDRAFGSSGSAGLRAFFNDSYEVDDATGQADWTPGLLDAFAKRRGYDLRRHLHQLFGGGDPDASARVLADFRETISDLLLETFTAGWLDWAHGRKALVRNQAHGSPASILDLYAASDIPETEGSEPMRFAWATSAAHVAGRRLVSAEIATWLGEHFRSTLADVKAAADGFFVAGVNHVVYHGTAYSPPGEAWPGWQFYASVEFNPQNAWWDDFGALNQYIARVQSFMQGGAPDQDVLLYYPLYDSLAVRGKGLLAHFGGASPPPERTAFERAAEVMRTAGFAHDFISDRQLRASRTEGGRWIVPGGAAYPVVVLPASRFIPLETLEHAIALARGGATIVSFMGLPADVSGLGDLEARRARFTQALSSLTFGSPDADGISEARVGSGRVLRGEDLSRLLARAGVARERMTDQGLRFARRRDAQGRMWFVSNPTDRAIDGWVPLRSESANLMIFDPLTGRRGGASVRGAGADAREVYLQLPARGSVVIAVSSAPAADRYPTYVAAGGPVTLSQPWNLRFISGGPSLPAARTVDRPGSWTAGGAEDVRSFSGTARYTTTFERPAEKAEAWLLDLGDVRESARVRLNGKDLGTLIAPPYRVAIDPRMLSARNELEVSVTNLSANRIADLDRRGVPWKKFYNVNFPPRLAENRGPDGLFTAARWAPLDSGLLGPVTLTPVTSAR